jgi:hypothetical protein
LSQSVRAESLFSLRDQPELSASSPLSASSSHADGYSGYNEFAFDLSFNGLGNLARDAPAI